MGGGVKSIEALFAYTSATQHTYLYSLGIPLAERNPSLLVWDDKRMKCEEKPWGYHGEWSTFGSPKAKTFWPAVPWVLALGLPQGLHSL
jgi:hypothetical protein